MHLSTKTLRVFQKNYADQARIAVRRVHTSAKTDKQNSNMVSLAGENSLQVLNMEDIRAAGNLTRHEGNWTQKSVQ